MANNNPNEGGIALRGPLSWQAVLALIAFLAGSLFSAGMGWGRSNDSLDNIQSSIGRIEGEINLLSDKYTTTDKAVTQELQKIEDHLSYDDSRLDKLERH